MRKNCVLTVEEGKRLDLRFIAHYFLYLSQVHLINPYNKVESKHNLLPISVQWIFWSTFNNLNSYLMSSVLSFRSQIVINYKLRDYIANIKTRNSVFVVHTRFFSPNNTIFFKFQKMLNYKILNNNSSLNWYILYFCCVSQGSEEFPRLIHMLVKCELAQNPVDVCSVRIGVELSLWKFWGEKLPTDWKARWNDEWNFLPWNFSSWWRLEDEGCVEVFLGLSSLLKYSQLIIFDCSQFSFTYLNIDHYIENASICSQLGKFCDQIYSNSLVSQYIHLPISQFPQHLIKFAIINSFDTLRVSSF